jgi:hypothetical protein
MSGSPLLKFNAFDLLNLLRLIFALVALAGTFACGGGSSTSVPTSGGGGRGGEQGGNPFFDMHINNVTTAWPGLRFGGIRLWDTSTGWAQINTAQGQYDWSRMDQWLSEAQTHNVDVLYNLARTPTWASSKPTDTNCAYATIGGGPGQCWPPTDLNSDGTGPDAIWISWVTAVVQHSRSSTAAHIKYYEIWNEWNVSIFWQGTVQQLVRMTQDARCVIEGPPPNGACNSSSSFPSGTGLDPTALIVTPSPNGAHTDLSAVSDKLNTFLQANGGEYADIIGFHCYVGLQTAGPPFPTPEDVNTVIDDLSITLSNFSSQTQGKALFCTEGGWSHSDVEGFTDPDMQAAFLARYYLLQQSKGIARVYWYRWDNPSPTGGSLWNPVTGISKAGTAYGQIYEWLAGAMLSSPCSVNGTVWTCTYTRSSGYRAIAVWDGDTSTSCYTAGTPACSTFTIPGGATYTEYRDVAGNVTSLKGGTSVPISAKPILLETGPLP